MKQARIPVALEGVPFIGLAAFAALITAILGNAPAALASLGAGVFALYFFRDPERVEPVDARAVAAPADGKVIVVKEGDFPLYGGRALKISIFMNVFNVHVNRAPLAGTVERVEHRPGRFFAADSGRAELENETCALVLRHSGGERVVCVQMAGLIARRIVCWAEPGDELRRGERYGLIRFGSRVDVYLPPGAAVNVRRGDKVRAGESVIGFMAQASSEVK